MLSIQGEEELISNQNQETSTKHGNNIDKNSLPDLVSRPVQLDVGLREVTLTPGVTLEISLQQDLVMTVRVKQENSIILDNSNNPTESRLLSESQLIRSESISQNQFDLNSSTSESISLNQINPISSTSDPIRSKAISQNQFNQNLSTNVESETKESNITGTSENSGLLGNAKSIKSTNSSNSLNDSALSDSSTNLEDSTRLSSANSCNEFVPDSIPCPSNKSGCSLLSNTCDGCTDAIDSDEGDSLSPEATKDKTGEPFDENDLNLDDIVNNETYRNFSSSDDEEWITQNVEELNSMYQPGDNGDSTDGEEDWGEIFEDCADYEESVTNFGCEPAGNDYYNYGSNQLQTIIEEEEEEYVESSSDESEESDKEETPIIEDLQNENSEKINEILSLDNKDSKSDRSDKSENSLDLDSDTEKSELEQFEILEQLCSSSSDDFDPGDFCKVQTDNQLKNEIKNQNDSCDQESSFECSTLSKDSSFSKDSLEISDQSNTTHESSDQSQSSSDKSEVSSGHSRNSTGTSIDSSDHIQHSLEHVKNSPEKCRTVFELNQPKNCDKTEFSSDQICKDTFDELTNSIEQSKESIGINKVQLGMNSFVDQLNNSGLLSSINHNGSSDICADQSGEYTKFTDFSTESIQNLSGQYVRFNSSNDNTNDLNDPLRKSDPTDKLTDSEQSIDCNGTVDESTPKKPDRISSFKEYLRRKNSFGSESSKGEYVNKLTLVQENDGRAKVKPVQVENNEAVKKERRLSLNVGEMVQKERRLSLNLDKIMTNEKQVNDDELRHVSNNEKLNNSVNYESLVVPKDNIVANNDCLKGNNENQNGVLKGILKSKILKSSLQSDHNFERKITLIDQENPTVDFSKANNGSLLKSILKQKRPPLLKSQNFDELNDSDNFADVSSNVEDLNLKQYADDKCDSYLKSNINNRLNESINEKDLSFEWHEIGDGFDHLELKGSDSKSRVTFANDFKSGLNDDTFVSDIDESVEVFDVLKFGSNRAGNVGLEQRMSEFGRRMSETFPIDCTTPRNSYEGSIPSDPNNRQYSIPVQPDSISMRNKKDKSSSSKLDEQSSSTDSNSLPKSALKRPGKKRKKHKVQFDESLNKFFDADYVILIREDECECGGELCCSSFLQDDDDEDSFADLEEDSSVIEIPEPPIEFVDQLTLSPPDGYKDTLQDYQQHDVLSGTEEPKVCEDHTTQTTPTSPLIPTSLESLAQADENDEYSNTGNSSQNTSSDRYIVETITMTTVTERRIVRETLDSSHVQPSREELSLRFVRPCSTKPGSAVRALFPSAVKSPDSEEDTDPLESSLIKRTIERNTLRRSLLKYPGDLRLRRKKQQIPSEESLEEKIRKLTCDIEEPEQEQRTSPQGQEENLNQPSYSVSRRLCEVLRKEQHPVAIEQQYPSYYETASFLAATATTGRLPCHDHHRPMSAVDLRPPGDLRLLESRPLSAEPPGTRDSISTDYSLGDIDEVLGDCNRTLAAADSRPGDGRPDVLAGTPDPPDELALFVEQDASRIERIRKRYSNSEEEGDDYGFSRRPSVRGIKPTFGSTTEILQRMQSQVGPGWPYYPQTSSLNGCRPGALTPSPSIRQCQPLCTAQPTVCPQPLAYPSVSGYPTAYLTQPYASNGYTPRLYARDMPLVRATQTPPHYYPRYRVGSPTKNKLEGRIGPEGAASSSHELSQCDDTSLRDSTLSIRDASTLSLRDSSSQHENSSIDSSLMYAMNV